MAKSKDIAYAAKSPLGYVFWSTLSVTRRKVINTFLKYHDKKSWRWLYEQGYRIIRIGEVK